MFRFLEEAGVDGEEVNNVALEILLFDFVGSLHKKRLFLNFPLKLLK